MSHDRGHELERQTVQVLDQQRIEGLQVGIHTPRVVVRAPGDLEHGEPFSARRPIISH